MCKVCGDEKEKKDFYHVPYFTQYKKHKVQWCRHCQTMFVGMKKDVEKRKIIEDDQKKFEVTFF